ncbi:MAG: NAD-dependent epimerase/dehydratase family protein [Oscillospiraceae bacterium]|nr:NAD-dependent epimerase/dehydratase family protein [Oscillospiraceae bacterium]
MKILITGGTVFASRFTAEYFSKNNEVYVLNRGTKPQSENVYPIIADRHNLGDILKKYEFDAVLDICGYNETDVRDLLFGLGNFKTYIFISSSAVYPETLNSPFKEEYEIGENKIWGDYGLNKIKAERYLTENCKNVYIIRPPYLYGKMNNLYREAFVFECAEQDRPFYVPNDGKMFLQFFDIEDMCRFMGILIERQPKQRIFNVGNPTSINIVDWAKLCYKTVGKVPEYRFVEHDIDQRSYFPFYNYEYKLDVEKMLELMPEVKQLAEGLSQSYEWFKINRKEVRRKKLIEFIDNDLRG